MLSAALREATEEVGLQRDETFLPRLALYYHQARSRDGFVNDNFTIFVIRAKSTQLEVDANEISGAHWFDVAPCLTALAEFLGDRKNPTRPAQAADAAKAAGPPDAVRQASLPTFLVVEGEQIGVMELLALQKHFDGQTLPVRYVDTGRPNPSTMF
jgi:hypothetical protein